MEQFKAICKRNGLKITPQRVAVYRVLRSSKEHPSADQVRKRLLASFPNISLDTVNRTLLTFARLNIIQIVEGYGGPRRFDPGREEHHHFYCLGCNKIVDFHDPALNTLEVPEKIRKKFTITGKRVCLTGYCETCDTQRN